MAGLPTIQVTLDDGTGTFPYDISSYVRLAEGIAISRGRSDELSEVSPGSLSLTLDNTDGRFTLGSTLIASPSPIKVDQRIRVRLTANATTVDRFTGYIQSWPVQWPSGGQEFSVVQVTATDSLARAERRPIPPIGQEEIPNLAPTVFYPLAEIASARSAADLSGNNKPQLKGVYPPFPGIWGTSGKRLTFGNETNGVTGVKFNGGQILAQYDWAGSATPGFLISFNTDYSTAVEKWLISDAEGSLYIRLNAGALNIAGTPVAAGLALNDSQWHTIGIRVTGPTTADVYVDGVRTDVGASTIYGAGGRRGLLVGGWDGEGETNDVFEGTIAYATAWVTAPSHAAFLAITNLVGRNGEGETGPDRLTRIAGYVGVPLGSFDTGLTPLAGINFDNGSAAQAFSQTVASEGGLVFANGSGNLTFYNRDQVGLKTAPDLTFDANQLSEETTFEVDTQGLANYFETTASGTGTVQILRNTASETNHGRYATSVTYDVLTNAEAYDRANWILANHAEPSPRLGDLTFDVLTLTAANQATVLGLDLTSWIRVTGLPPQTPGGTTANFTVQGFTEVISLTSWTFSPNVTDRAMDAVWILGHATYGVLGSTTRLGV